MLSLTVAVILHGITLTGHLGTIDHASCPTAAHALSGNNWVVTCTDNSYTISGAGTGISNSWTSGGCSFDQHGNIKCP